MKTLITSKYKTYSSGGAVPVGQTGLCYTSGDQFIFHDTAYNASNLTADGYAPWLEGVEAYYELSTPEEYLLDTPVPANYYVNDFGTEQRLPEDTASVVAAPIRYDVNYAMNAVDAIRRLPDNYVSGTESQEFTSTEKAQARTNIGAIAFSDFASLPTTDPQEAGALWNDNGTLKISAGGTE